MQIRSLPIGQGLAWFKQSIDLGGHNPRGVFGAAALMLVAFYVLTLVLVVPMIALVAGQDEPALADVMGTLWPFLLAVVLAVAVLMPFLVGGVMHVIRETEAGRKPGARQVFATFRAGVSGRLAAVGLLMLAIQVVGGALVMLAGGQDYLDAYVEMMRGLFAGEDPRTLAQPDTSLLMFLLQLLVNYVGYAVLLFSVPSVLFLRTSLGEAVAGSLRASVRNVGANLLAGVLLVVAMVIATLLFALLLALVSLVAGAIHPWLGVALTLLLILLYGSALVVVSLGAAYLAWRDTFEGTTPPAAEGTTLQADSGGFEA